MAGYQVSLIWANLTQAFNLNEPDLTRVFNLGGFHLIRAFNLGRPELQFNLETVNLKRGNQ